MRFANDTNRARHFRTAQQALLLISTALSMPIAASAQLPTVAEVVTCPTIRGQGEITVWTQMSGSVMVNHREYGNAVVDITAFASIFDYPGLGLGPWPGAYNLYTGMTLPLNKYVSAAFTVPSSIDMTSLRGEYSIEAAHFSAPVSMSISTMCGDFGQFDAVIANCLLNSASAGQSLSWQGAADAQACVLQPGVTYYLNLINADISQLASTGIAVSTANAACTAAGCFVPLINGPGNWGVADDIFYSPFE